MASTTALAPATTTTSTSTTSSPSLRPAWLSPTLYPFAPRTHVTDEGRMSYLDEGEGRPILFVHGTPSWSFEWRHAIASLRSSHRCIAPDHLGFGLSDKPRNAAYAPADHARRLRALVQALDLRDLTLVVHDFGGPIGLSLALEEPERIASVVVLNSWMWAHADRPAIRRMSSLVASPLGRFLYLWLNASPRWIVPMAFGDRSRLDRQTHQHYLRPFGRRHERLGPWTLGCELAGSDPWYASLWARREVLSRRPLTFAWGMKDPAFGPDYLARWREAFPNARTVEIPGAGHFPQEEAPDLITDAIRFTARTTTT
ncbi:alpha/beta fold hydrolase [Paraliomyxa miuraensis]|uniref:alpha/beta fold hydrolase n=1 Tax=Paraliomyxa miuraensis TaxID=376150 RepID=UPI0022545227|nr:alpha/beta fold hydrolase [Paraliomyxa miuraensis]MCX4247510.1 alpha/beta fold hydrolase [Paraliomyxa miuraensis]